MIGTGRPQTKDAPAFGKRLAAARLAKGWSQTELAARLNTTLKMIDYYERRANNPSVEFARQAARVLGLSVAELLGEEGYCQLNFIEEIKSSNSDKLTAFGPRSTSDCTSD